MPFYSINKLVVILLILAASFSSVLAATLPYPHSKIEIVTDTLHGVVIDDPYQWLEDQNSPETRAWINSQNEFTHSLIEPLSGGESLRKRYSELQRVDAIGSPIIRGDNYFFLKRKAEEDLYSIYLRKGLHGEDLRLVDPIQLSANKTVSISVFAISDNGSILAYRVRKGGEDEVEIRFLNVENKSDLSDKLTKGRYYSVVFTPDNKGFYYALHTKEGTRIFYRQFGADSKDDKYIFGEGYGFDKGVSIVLSSDKNYLIFTVWYGSASQKTDVFYKKINPEAPILTLVDDIEATFSCDIADGICYITTDLDAPRRRILTVDLTNPDFNNWQEVIPQQEATIEEYYLINGKIILQLIEKASSRMKIYNHDGSGGHDIELPAIGTIGAIRGNWQDDKLMYSFSSFNMPSTIFHYDFEKDKSEIWERPESPVNSEDYVIEQVWYKSYDSTDVPMFLFHHKDLVKDGNNPTLVYGYGGFNSSQTPYFSTYGITLADHGAIFVLTNLRGGGEFGEAWHRAAMLEKKQNTFDDFYAAAEWLIENNYTNSSKLAAMGGSNGGLLVGAAVTQRPELFDVIICTYPLLDMINYHKWLVGAFWVPEYGSSDDAEQFKFIHAYSPYHNVRKGVKYPAVMFITGDADTRVDPAHARKMTALMQAATSSDNPIILDYNTKAGHSGGKPIDLRIEDNVREMKFLFWQWDELE